jgi:methylenetetrahydrofolate reductase (NADPH)
MARIADLLRSGPTVSFEFFPPKDDEEASRLRATIDALKPLSPSFVSVTYRGGRSSRERTTNVVRELIQQREIVAMPHLTCVAHTRDELREIVGGFHAAGVENLLALGGDPLPDEESYRQLNHAIELVELALEQGAECIGVAAHPSGHPDSQDKGSDRRHLAAKLRLADFAITQFFFRAEEWLRLVDELQALGVDRPVIPGIMPITSLQSIVRMSELSGYSVPADIVERLEPLEDDPKALRAAGIELACQLCQDLLDAGAPGLHFFTLNRSTATREIHTSLRLTTA